MTTTTYTVRRQDGLLQGRTTDANVAEICSLEGYRVEAVTEGDVA